MSDRWPDELLDRMRQITDEELDPIMQKYFAERGMKFLAELHPFLHEWTTPLTPGLPPEIVALFERPVEYPEWVDPEKLALAETLFLRYGPVALCVLLLNGFPRSMANPAVATAIDAARLFDPLVVRRRMREVVQFTLNTSRRAGFQQPYWSKDRIGKNIGTWSGLKLRLKHGRVRLRVAAAQPPVWDYATYGGIINQEDLADGMLQFCLGIIDGLPKAGIVQTPDEQEAMLNIWSTIAFHLSLRPELRPANMAEARELSAIVFRRNARHSEAGVRVIADMLGVANDILPWWLHGSSAAFMRHQVGDEIANMLEVPRSLFWRFIIWITAPFWGVNGPFATLATFISPHIVNWLLAEEEGSGCQVQDPDAMLIMGVDRRKL